jgi:Rod binding domain-containing protein
MSIQAAASADATTTGLPAVNQALEPKWVRDGSAATQKAYETALSFEETLVEQLSKSMTATSGLEGESSEGGSGSEEGGSFAGSANSTELSSMLPQALASGVMSAGGLGLAAQMTRELEGTQSAAQAGATGGTSS